jgi:hypothetical protein
MDVAILSILELFISIIITFLVGFCSFFSTVSGLVGII